jgi:tryptophan halogenase
MNIVVVGGGTAGYITALYAKKAYPNFDITLIESEEIGILGAGEGSTPHFIELFDFLEIPFSDLVKNCNATVKNGIKFTNWSNNNEYFFHPFSSQSLASNDCNYLIDSYLEQDTGFSHIYSSQFDHKLDDYAFVQKISNDFFVPFIKNNNVYVNNVIKKFDHFANWSLHFDARTLAKYLRKIAELRSIVRIEGIVKKIETDENGYINKLLVNDKYIDVDFVFDCSGFKRLIIGNFYKSKWKSHSDHLPAKKAIPFFLPIEKEIPPYTEAIAMDYGWMWKIPLQHRYGCGYVFDSDFISDQDAKKEIDEYLGFEVESPKTFFFNAGFYKEILINNCLAVGLSSGFLEPLEATSMWQMSIVLKIFFSMNGVVENNYINRNKINNLYKKDVEEIVDLLYLHYITYKKNTIFWKYFIKNNKMTPFIENILQIIKERNLKKIDFNDKNMYTFMSYFYILIGNKIIEKKHLQKYLSLMKIDHSQEYLDILKNQKKLIPNLINHKNFLLNLKYDTI